MSEKKRIRYTYNSLESWEEFDAQVQKMIEDDTGEGNWIATKSLPPIAFPPPLSTSCIEQIKALDGSIVVTEFEEDDD